MALVSSVINFLRRERDYRRTRTSLHGLDDRLLNDIGVRRDQIDTLALELRAIERRHGAAEAQDRRNQNALRKAVGGGGFAHQH
jgi:uncharacterized protein YjiS (DUF1127 family)